MLFLAPLLAVLGPACDRAAEPADHDPHPEVEAQAQTHGQPHGQLHGQDARGLVFVDPQDAEHPGTVQVGTIPYGEVRDASVKLKNVEARPITITRLTAGCSCTFTEIFYLDASGEKVVGRPRSTESVLTVPPGVTAEIVLHVDSKLAPLKNKDKNVVIQITTDSDLDPYLSIEARMRVEAMFQCAPPELGFGRVGVNSGGVGKVDIAAAPELRPRLVSVLAAPAGMEATLEPGPYQGIESWVVTARLEPPVELGYHEGVIRFATTGPNGEGEGHPFDVRVTWNGSPDVEVVPARLLVRPDPRTHVEGADVEVLSHMSGHYFRVVRHELEGASADDFDVTIAPVFPDEQGRTSRWKVALVPKKDLGARAIEGKLILELDDSQYPKFEIPIIRLGSPGTADAR
jgi:hypothetical protein